ncbi:MAG: alpha-N-acetylglucosaminidase TIM-barrel domain-containing protein [Thomasclavelia ramosa]
MSREVLNSLLEYDQEAVWMVRAWWSNPTNDLLKGMGDDREDHVIILDLNGLNDAYDSYWDKTEYNGTVLESDEFNSTSWVWCMLENMVVIINGWKTKRLLIELIKHLLKLNI